MIIKISELPLEIQKKIPLSIRTLKDEYELDDLPSREKEIIRTYIERRFSIKAMEQTTEEILSDFRKIDTDNYEMLRSLLNLADLVKFAKGQALPDENVTHIDNAYTFINNTKVKPVESTQTEQKEIE